MRKPWRSVAVVSAITAGILTVSTLYAEGASMMGEGGIMSRIEQMGGMMEGCSRMMGIRNGHSERLNQQWRTRTPRPPETES